MIQAAINKAAVLIEALPYIQKFRGDTVVVKFGGSIIDDEASYANILKDIAFMELVGLRPVVVHGGGKAISRRMTEAGLKPNFLNGLRVTDAETIKVVEQTLNHEVNPHLVEVVEGFSCKAQGIHGQDIISVQKHTDTDPQSGETLDWGFVGDVTRVDVSPINHALENETIPIITPIGKDADGQCYNINADAAAGAIARELHARKLVFLSDVPGLLKDPEDPDTLMSTLRLNEVEQLIKDGVISGGMLPKVGGAIKALHAGIKKTHIIDAGMTHSLLLELFTDKGVGTEIILDSDS